MPEVRLPLLREEGPGQGRLASILSEREFVSILA